MQERMEATQRQGAHRQQESSESQHILELAATAHNMDFRDLKSECGPGWYWEGKRDRLISCLVSTGR